MQSVVSCVWLLDMEPAFVAADAVAGNLAHRWSELLFGYSHRLGCLPVEFACPILPPAPVARMGHGVSAGDLGLGNAARPLVAFALRSDQFFVHANFLAPFCVAVLELVSVEAR